MGKVVVDTSMSLDGFITGPNPRPEEPMGDGGERLHEWAFGEDEQNRELMENALAELGAVICGRTTYDGSLPYWDADGPTGPARRPVFVVTHNAPLEGPANGVYTFVTSGIEDALEQAQAAAGERDVTIMGGANIAGQYLDAGLVDEVSIHLVPVLYGAGTRAFQRENAQRLQVEPPDVQPTADALHLRFRVA